MLTKRLFFQTLSPSQENILLALGRYKYLTTGQLLRLGIMSDRANLNKLLAELRSWKNPLVGSIAFGVHPTRGKLENVHHLTSHGAELIKERLGADEKIRFPKNSTQLFQQDYFHRIHTVDVHIALQQSVSRPETEILFFLTYFDKVSSGKKKGFRAESSIVVSQNDYLIADGICMLQTLRRKELYAIEVYNGDDTQRVHKSLHHHLRALSEGQPSKMFGLEYGSRVLCIFELDNYKQMAMKRLFEDPTFQEAKSHFLFKSLDEVTQSAVEGWELFDGERVNMY